MSSRPKRHPPAEEKLFIPGPAGRLEAVLRPLPEGAKPRCAVILCHPHPLHGGTLDNKILYRIARRLPLEADSVALRFNFRGTGESEGNYDEGRGEQGDVLAVVDWLAARHAGVPLALVGYSFGAAVGLKAAATDRRVERLVGLGLPLGLEGLDFRFLEDLKRPLLLVHGERDEFVSGRALEAQLSDLPSSPELTLISGADHLFTGVEDQAVDAVLAFLSRS
jgi:alpha/beta superfamily hydrolase